MDFRYIVPTVVCGMAFAGVYLSEEGRSKVKKYVTAVFTVLCVLFCMTSGALYMCA